MVHLPLIIRIQFDHINTVKRLNGKMGNMMEIGRKNLTSFCLFPLSPLISPFLLPRFSKITLPAPADRLHRAGVNGLLAIAGDALFRADDPGFFVLQFEHLRAKFYAMSAAYTEVFIHNRFSHIRSL